jgi:hypothetical protein
MTTSRSASVPAARPAGRRGVRQITLLGWLVALGCVVVAALGLQLSEPQGNVENVTGIRDQPVAYDDGTVTVGDVLVGQGVENYDRVTRTVGMFVTVKVTLSANGNNRLRLATFQLLSGDRTYGAFESAIMVVQPGFAETAVVAFEVDPARIDGLTLQTSGGEVVNGYHQQIRVHLGITPENAQAWREAAAGQLLGLDDTTTWAPR